MIQPGDILLFKGNTILSRIIRWFTGSPYTHVGVAVTPDYVYEIDIDRRLAIHPIRNTDYDVFRYRGELTPTQKTIMQRFALERAKNNKGYDWLRICSFVFQKLFRTKKAFHHMNKVICSEIVDELYHQAGVDLVPHRADGDVTPADLASSPALVLVFSHSA